MHLIVGQPEPAARRQYDSNNARGVVPPADTAAENLDIQFLVINRPATKTETYPACDSLPIWQNRNTHPQFTGSFVKDRSFPDGHCSRR
jgi:hypothetical protein